MSGMNGGRGVSVVRVEESGEALPDELLDLVRELEEDPEIRRKLGDAPRAVVRAEPAELERNDEGGAPAGPIAPAPARASVTYRDPADVVTIHRLAWTAMFMVLAVVVCVGLVIAMYLRRPDRIVVDRSSGRVLMINDREYGETEAVQMGPDKLTNKDKEYITREFVQALYRIDPATRPKDVERALRMMVPDSAMKFVRFLKQDGTLDRQRDESWQTVWTPQDVSIDRADPYTVRVIGRQDVTRVVSGVAQNETRQLNLTVKLVADPQGRADRNLRSGFLVASIDYKELGDAAPAASASSAPAAAPSAAQVP